jgi:hypothetical protein
VTTEIIIATTAFLTAVAGLGVPMLKLWQGVAPYLRRRALPISVVADEAHDEAAAKFVASLRQAGYRTVERTRVASRVPASARAVVIWAPEPDEAIGIIDDVRDSAPEAEVLVFSRARLPGPVMGLALISNSEIRLRMDLGSVSEAAA